MSHLENAKDLYSKMYQGQMMEVFEKYYDDDVQIIEANGEVRNGKDVQRQALVDWVGSIEEIHGGGFGAITVSEDGNTVCVESWADNTFKGMGRMKMEEVAVQTWKDGKIIKERFYYNMPPMPEQS